MIIIYLWLLIVHSIYLWLFIVGCVNQLVTWGHPVTCPLLRQVFSSPALGGMRRAVIGSSQRRWGPWGPEDTGLLSPWQVRKFGFSPQELGYIGTMSLIMTKQLGNGWQTKLRLACCFALNRPSLGCWNHTGVTWCCCG